MKLSDFVFLEDPKSSALYILQTHSPFIIGHVWKLTEAPEFAHPVSKCPGYRVYVEYYACLLESSNYALIDNEKIVETLQRMAMFYYDTRIHPNKGRFKRYED